MADSTQTSFPKMGDDGIPNSVVNMSGQRSKYTHPIVKAGNSKGGSAEAATANHRKGKLERLGAKGAPQATMCKPNAKESGYTQRNVRNVPSAVGNRDFYAKRQYGQVQQ